MLGGTIYEQALERNIKKYMRDRDWAALLIETVTKLNDGFWEQEYVDFFFQKGGWMDSAYTLQDAYAFCLLHHDLGAGNLVACDLHIGESPSADTQIEVNLCKLRKGLRDLVHTSESLPQPTFDVRLWCGTQDEDGALSAFPYLSFRRFLNGEPKETFWLPVDNVPLEVGSQSAAKTLIQLRSRGSLARWPYGSDTIRIFMGSDTWKPACRQFPYPSGARLCNAASCH